jgi:D-alanyl-lipoteichoic acid acyltransferase DltB (MBOAT superfamily)
VAIADALAPLVETAFADPAARTWGELAAGLYAFSLQIYGDFSGYSDIARGAARLLGFELQQNFLAPYLSRGPAEFWRRWHVSLSSWVGDYLFLPLGRAAARAVARWRLPSLAVETRLAYALAVVPAMLLVGLWHGAAWTFVAWGGLHGAWLAAQRAVAGARRPGPPRWLAPRRGPAGGGARAGRAGRAGPAAPAARWGRALWRAGEVVLTFHLVTLAWIPFRAGSLDAALAYAAGLLRGGAWGGFAWSVPFAGALLWLLDRAQLRWGDSAWLAAAPRPLRWAAAELLLVAILAAAVHQAHTVTPFIYFQF